MAGDFHNAIYPPDVNNDAALSIVDLYSVVATYRAGGARPLTAEGEGGGQMLYVDVNGDDYLSLGDVLDVVHELRGEGEATARDDNFNLNDPSDPFTVTSNSANNPLPVLANDSPSNTLTITRVASLQGGFLANSSPTEFGGTVTIQGAGVNNTIVYTPAPDFFGQDRFRYEVRDTTDDTLDTAFVTVFVEPGQNDVFVRFTYQALDPTTLTPITSVEVGETFVVRAFVQDTRNMFQPTAERGVAAAALDVTYNSTLATLVPVSPQSNIHGFNRDFEFGPEYRALESVDGFSEVGGVGLIDEASAAQTAFEDSSQPFPQPLGPNPIPFFDATFQALAIGTILVQGDPADRPENQIVTLRPGQLDPVPVDAVDYGSLQLQIVAPRGAVADMFTRNEDLTPGATPDLSNPILDVLANDTNLDGTTPPVGVIVELRDDDETSATQITLPSGSTIEINAGGQALTYTPAPNFSGLETFTYGVDFNNDGVVDDRALVTINVIAINDPPVAVDDSFPPFGTPPFIENGPQVSLDVLANDSDPDGDPLTIIAVTQPTGGGVVAIAPGGQSLLYNPGSIPGETFTYTISDGQGGTDTATVTTTIQRIDQDAAILINLLDLNGNPLPLGPDNLPQLTLGQQFVVQVQVQDLRDEDETNLGLGVFTAFLDLNYTAALLDQVGSVMFGANYNNTDFRDPGNASDGLIDDVGSPQTNIFAGPIGAGPFTVFTVTLQAEQFGKATIFADPADEPGHEIQLFDPPTILDPDDVRFDSVMVNIINPNAGTPVANNDTYTVPGNTPLQITTRAAGVLANDVDPEGDNTIQAVLVPNSGPTNGVLTFNSDGTFTYTPNPGFFGTDSFRYRATDGGPLSNEATVTINVTAKLENDQFTGAINQIIQGNVLANDAVPPNSTAVLVNAPARAGAFVFNPNGSFIYTPQPNQAYVDTFTYRVGTQTATVTISIGTTAGSVSGVVFTDENDNRAIDQRERRLGGITVTLRNNTTGETFSTRTSAAGAYTLPNVPAGQYTLTAAQPAFMIDGWNIINNQQTVVSDSIVLNLTGAAQRVDFGELGLRAEFVKPVDFFGEADPNGFQVATNVGRPLGQEHWFSFLDGWGNFTKAEASVSPDGATVTLRLTRDDGQVFTLNNINIESDPRVRTLGRLGDGIVIRFEGTPAAFAAGAATGQLGGEGESDAYTDAVDQLFAGWSN